MARSRSKYERRLPDGGEPLVRDREQVVRVEVLPVIGLTATACGGSGQTGSAQCVLTVSCACELLTTQIVAKGHFVEVDAARGEGRVALDAILTTPMPLGASPPGGMELVGPFRAFAQPRAQRSGSCEESRAEPPVVGAPVLVTFPRRDYEKVGCTNCPEGCDAGCSPATDPPAIATSFWVLPWAEEYDFGGAPVSLTELASTHDVWECHDRFPAPQAECNDVVSVEEGPFGSCAVAPRSSPSTFVGLALVALVDALRRLRRRRPR